MIEIARKRWFVPIVIFLLAIIVISSLAEGEGEKAYNNLSVEERLEEMCNLVKGVSDARVMITYEQGATVSTFGYEKGEERISGVAIACNGGDDPEIKLALYELVDALFNIKSTRITVSPRN